MGAELELVFLQMPGYDNRTGNTELRKYTGCAELSIFLHNSYFHQSLKEEKEKCWFVLGFLGRINQNRRM